MTEAQFGNIKYFRPREVEATGAKLEDIQISLMEALDRFRERVECPVNLIKNGMTTGTHSDEAHYKGLVADVWLKLDLDPQNVFKYALAAGFRRVGIYWNGKKHSYHLGVSDQYGFWTATKDQDGLWNYDRAIIDPKTRGT